MKTDKKLSASAAARAGGKKKKRAAGSKSHHAHGKRRVQERRRDHSAVWTGIYYGFLLLIVVGVLATSMYAINYLHGAMAAYEASQIKYVVEEAAAPIMARDYATMARYEDQSIFTYETVDQYVAYMHNLLDNKELTYSESRTGDEHFKKYTVMADGLRIGEFYIRHMTEDTYGNWLWRPAGMHFDVLQQQSYVIDAPTNSTVYVNGQPLDRQWITKSDIPEFEVVIDLPMGVTVPTRCVYRFDRYFGVDSVRVVDDKGRDNPITQEGNHYVAAANYDDDTMSAEFDERVIEVSRKLSCYMSNDTSLYYACKDLIDDSPAEHKLYNFDISWIMNHRSYDFIDIEVGHYLKHTDYCFSVEIRYDFKVIYYTVDPEYYPTAYRLYFFKDGDAWRVYDFEMI